MIKIPEIDLYSYFLYIKNQLINSLILVVNKPMKMINRTVDNSNSKLRVDGVTGVDIFFSIYLIKRFLFNENLYDFIFN
jgi:hypothetical protein